MGYNHRNDEIDDNLSRMRRKREAYADPLCVGGAHMVTPAISFGIAAALAVMALIPYDINDPAWETGLNGVRLVLAIAVGFLVAHGMSH
jgi:hypothetical protein